MKKKNNNNNGSNDSSDSTDDDDDDDNENDSKLEWWEDRKKWHPIDTFFELSSQKSFKIIKIVNKKPLQFIKRTVPLKIVGGPHGTFRSKDDLENDIANELFFATSDAKVCHPFFFFYVEWFDSVFEWFGSALIVF